MPGWIFGNWKMNGSLKLIAEYVPSLVRHLPTGMGERGVRAVLCPPLPYLIPLAEQLRGSGIELGAQDVHPMSEGAFTGEVSPAMLTDLGVRFCIFGHSERSLKMGLTDSFFAQIIHAIIEAGIEPVLCVGETLAEREAGQQESVIESQVLQALSASAPHGTGRRGSDAPFIAHPAITEADARRLTIAYEPVWAIGTGVNASPEDANQMHAFIRGLLAERFPNLDCSGIKLLYGGSVTPDNAAGLLAQSHIDGALVGGASLKAESFLQIILHASN